MIQANELRRNNKVYWKERVIIVDCIHPKVISEFGAIKESINETYDRKFIKCEEIEPIPLTEKILLDNSYNTEDFIYGKYIYVSYNDSSDGSLKIEHYTSNISDNNVKLAGKFFSNDVELLTVHQLQNLYYILKGKDLDLEVEL